MTEREADESIGQLRELARELGVSDRQLRRWRGNGLMPRPIRRRWKGRGAGTETFYPPGTCDQLRAVVRWFTYKQRVEVVRWALWCDGFDVRFDFTTFLLDELSKARATASDELDAYDQEEFDSPLERFEEGPLPPPFRRLERQGYGGEYFSLLVGIVRTAAKGQSDFLPINLREIGTMISHALPKDLMRLMDDIGARSDLETGHDLDRSLELFDYAALAEYVRGDPHRLQAARDEALVVFRLVWPERAEIEPLPPVLFTTVLMNQRVHRPFAPIVAWLCEQPGGTQMMKKWLDFE